MVPSVAVVDAGPRQPPFGLDDASPPHPVPRGGSDDPSRIEPTSVGDAPVHRGAQVVDVGVESRECVLVISWSFEFGAERTGGVEAPVEMPAEHRIGLSAVDESFPGEPAHRLEHLHPVTGSGRSTSSEQSRRRVTISSGSFT